jgi:hypothetical protein
MRGGLGVALGLSVGGPAVRLAASLPTSAPTGFQLAHPRDARDRKRAPPGSSGEDGDDFSRQNES